jgi:iojap-like ribosome-associated protein
MISSSEGAPAKAPVPSADIPDTDPSTALAVVLASLDNSKAEEIVALDIAAKTPIADHMVVASGRSHRHVAAIAEHLLKDIKDAGFGNAAIEGQTACDWVLIDAGDIIVHIFRPEVRTFYNLEKMWSDPEGQPQRRLG